MCVWLLFDMKCCELRNYYVCVCLRPLPTQLKHRILYIEQFSNALLDLCVPGTYLPTNSAPDGDYYYSTPKHHM